MDADELVLLAALGNQIGAFLQKINTQDPDSYQNPTEKFSS
jgi:hypothetical protein